MNTPMNGLYAVFARGKGYVVARRDWPSEALAHFTDKYEAYADADRRNTDAFIDHMEAQS
jgi:hypothetical protein